MKLIISKNADINYLAKIVRIENFRKHSNPEVERLKCCSIDGFNIITGIDSPAGFYVYFPVMCQINPQFLNFANLYRHKELNANPEKSGMFEDNGRVKAISLKGEKSEGFIIDYEIFEAWILSSTNKDINISVGQEFDTVEDSGKEITVCKKYTIKTYDKKKYTPKVKGNYQDKIIPSQFRFHYETSQYKRVPTFVNPNDIIHISSKIHGTSVVVANVLVRKQNYWYTPILKWITEKVFKDTYIDTKYDDIYSSRKVIKNQYYNEHLTEGYYKVDVWKYANDIIYPKLPAGYTAYAEIVGYTPDGSYIQREYDYGCIRPTDPNDYESEVHYKVRIYRITITNVNGDVYELTPTEVKRWCEENGLVSVQELYVGKASDLYGLPEDGKFGEFFIDKLANDENFFMELNSPDCNNPVPHEGIVIKVFGKNSQAVKLKCFRFLNKEMAEQDAGISNIEDNA